MKTKGKDTKEPSQMIEKRVWGPAHVHRLSALARGRIIRSRMFLKEKYLPTGHYEKLKARLVTGGNQQDKDLYEDLSSPTARSKIGSVALYADAYIGNTWQRP
jgi:hypothetical protein